MRTSVKTVTLFRSGGGELPVPMDTVAAWYDASDISTLFQDSAGTVPVTANDHRVGCWKDKGLYGVDILQPTTSIKPFYKTSAHAGKPGLFFPYYFMRSTTNAPIGSFAAFAVFKLSAGVVLAEHGPDTYTADGAFCGVHHSEAIGARRGLRQQRGLPIGWAIDNITKLVAYEFTGPVSGRRQPKHYSRN